MARRGNRPKPFGVGRSVRVRVHSGPKRGTTDVWRWRADRQLGAVRDTIWTGWASEADVENVVMDVLRSRGEGTVSSEDVRTVHDLMDCWAASQLARSDLSPHTKAAAEPAAARVSGVIGPILLERLGKRELEQLRDRMGDSGATVARTLKYLRQAWGWGRGLGVVPDRDLPTVKVQRTDPVRSRFTPSRFDVARLLVEVRGRSDGAYRGVVIIAATGARPGEAEALRWRGVSDDCRRAELVGKTGPRVVELHPEVTAELRKWLEPKRAPIRQAAERLARARAAGDEQLVRHMESVIASMEAGLRDERVVGVTDETIRWQLREAADRLKLPRVTPTGLRRYVTDALYDTGALPDVEAAIVGHSPEEAQRTYREHRRSAAQRRAILAAGLGVPSVEGADVIEFER